MLNNKEVLTLLKTFVDKSKEEDFSDWIEEPMFYISNKKQSKMGLPEKMKIIKTLDADFGEEKDFISLSSEQYNRNSLYCFCALFEARHDNEEFIYFVSLNYGSDWEGKIVRVDIPKTDNELSSYLTQFKAIVAQGCSDSYFEQLVTAIKSNYIVDNFNDEFKLSKNKSIKM